MFSFAVMAYELLGRKLLSEDLPPHDPDAAMAWMRKVRSCMCMLLQCKQVLVWFFYACRVVIGMRPRAWVHKVWACACFAPSVCVCSECHARS